MCISYSPCPALHFPFPLPIHYLSPPIVFPHCTSPPHHLCPAPPCLTLPHPAHPPTAKPSEHLLLPTRLPSSSVSTIPPSLSPFLLPAGRPRPFPHTSPDLYNFGTYITEEKYDMKYEGTSLHLCIGGEFLPSSCTDTNTRMNKHAMHIDIKIKPRIYRIKPKMQPNYIPRKIVLWIYIFSSLMFGSY